MRVSAIMSAPSCRADPESTLAEAATLMAERRVGSALVMEGEQLTGILTERDVLRALSSAHDAATRPVAEWMTRVPRTVTPETDVRDALRMMVEGSFRHLPVVNGDRVVGVLSMRDIAGTLSM